VSFETVASILQIIFADIILSGDNALVIGMAAAGLAPEFRRRAIMIGMMMAAVMRIVFAVIASFLISIKGILLLGGLLLAWVPCEAPQTGRQALTAFMKRSRMTTGSIVITGIFALPLSHLQTMIVISPESSAS